ncbi:unnamed protein product, partial [Staurois parvus]
KEGAPFSQLRYQGQTSHRSLLTLLQNAGVTPQRPEPAAHHLVAPPVSPLLPYYRTVQMFFGPEMERGILGRPVGAVPSARGVLRCPAGAVPSAHAVCPWCAEASCGGGTLCSAVCSWCAEVSCGGGTLCSAVCPWCAGASCGGGTPCSAVCAHGMLGRPAGAVPSVQPSALRLPRP